MQNVLIDLFTVIWLLAFVMFGLLDHGYDSGSDLLDFMVHDYLQLFLCIDAVKFLKIIKFFPMYPADAFLLMLIDISRKNRHLT